MQAYERLVSWLDQTIPLHNADDQTTEWMASARTPETRARIRRWSRAESIGLAVALIGLILLLAAPVATVVLLVWFGVAGIERTDVYWWLWGIAVGVPLVGGIVMAVGSRQRLVACFADAYVSTGRVDRVIEEPGDDDHAWYQLRVSSELPNGVVLHRTVYRDGNDPRRRTGGPVRFRHNTLDPDDLHDVLFDGWPDDARTGRR
ncbi:hypothetical protein KVF89_29010 [Nocardioides carbamazepini]|uniref:hypothetical protein n=1 Tax=Nocardioides carbamazepini TaxID=2854259 RepID=UPI00214A57F2|nr:hypothetical protein [Nocardioides carbamazepini]MCR1786610.1 hypothetical protein [Nocardioides carbamazepini]